MRIAYVEDNATNQALVERVARMTQHVIVPYSEGEIALDALRSESFDLIMMDIELAGKVNGLDVVRALRDTGLKTPIIAVTAYAMKGDRDRCLDAGCNDYLPKPIPIKDLLALLNRYDATFKAALAEAPQEALHAAAPAPEAPAMTPAAATPASAVTPPVEPVAEAAPPVAPAPAIPVTPPVPDAPAPVTPAVPVAAEAPHAAPLLATAPVESGRPPDSALASATPPTTEQTIEPAATPTTAPTTA